MLVFIRMVPASVNSGDLRGFIYKGMGSFWLRLLSSQGSTARISIIRIVNQNTHSVEFHGLVDIEPAASAQAAIRRLNRTSLYGTLVEVREFFDRSTSRDRRKSQTSMETDSFKDLRKGDRRSQQLAIESVPVSGFSKSL